MEALRLSSSELLKSENKSDPATNCLASYATEIWQHPKEHVPEIGGAALLLAGLSVGGTIAARQLLSQIEKPTVKAIASDLGSARLNTASAEQFARLDAKSVADAVELLKERDGIELSSWTGTSIDGSHNSTSGLSVLRASDLAALQVKRDGDTVFAHKVSISQNGDTVFSYYTHEPMGLKNPWAKEESSAWPLNKGGPFDGLKQAGIEVMDLESKPRGLQFGPPLDSLTIKWTDLKAIAKPGDLPASFSSIEIQGPKAALNGIGELRLKHL